MADRARTAADAALARIERDGTPGIFIEVLARSRVLAAATAVDARLDDGELLPLAGTTLAVKGNIDVAGHRTTAGCPSFGTVAVQSAPAVAALEDAGAVVVAIANLDQFATGLVGTRSPYGACPNAHWPHLVSGGSSSGSAVAVARGLVDLALGTDTAGSGRVPAAANGIVGVKPTPGRVSTRGVVPACRSFDCVSTFGRTAEAAVVAAELASGFDPLDPWSARPSPPEPLCGPLRLGVPGPHALGFEEDRAAAARFATAVTSVLEAVPVEPVDVDLAPFLAAGELLYGGAFVAERYAAVGRALEVDGPDLDPTVREVVLRGRDLAAWELARDVDRLRSLRREAEATWATADVLVVPTVPRIPTRAEVDADPIGPNVELGRFTTFANLLGLCAVTLPVGSASDDGPPTSITLLGPSWSDDVLAGLARRITDPTGRTASLRSA